MHGTLRPIFLFNHRRRRENTKPYPEGIFKALRAIGVDADRTIYVGDRASDILAGQNALVETMLVDGWLPESRPVCRPNRITYSIIQRRC